MSRHDTIHYITLHYIVIVCRSRAKHHMSSADDDAARRRCLKQQQLPWPLDCYVFFLAFFIVHVHVHGFTTLTSAPYSTFSKQHQHQHQNHKRKWILQSTKNIKDSSLEKSSSNNHKRRKSQKKNTTCKYCHTEFTSRNAFFRHMRTDPVCCNKAMAEAEATGNVEEINRAIFLNAPKRSLLLLVGYYNYNYTYRYRYRCKEITDISTRSCNSSSSEESAMLLRKAFIYSCIVETIRFGSWR